MKTTSSLRMCPFHLIYEWDAYNNLNSIFLSLYLVMSDHPRGFHVQALHGHSVYFSCRWLQPSPTPITVLPNTIFVGVSCVIVYCMTIFHWDDTTTSAHIIATMFDGVDSTVLLSCSCVVSILSTLSLNVVRLLTWLFLLDIYSSVEFQYLRYVPLLIRNKWHVSLTF